MTVPSQKSPLESVSPALSPRTPILELPNLGEVEPIDPESLMLDIGSCWELFRDVRRRPDYPDGFRDGFPVANATLLDPRGYDAVGRDWIEARAKGEDPREFFLARFDMQDTAVYVRDAHPDETIVQYMDFLADEGLRHYIRDGGIRLGLPYRADAPGSRFIFSFPADDAVSAIGKAFRGNLAGAHETLGNNVYQSRRYNGLIPNFNALLSMDRGQWPGISFSVEIVAGSHGDRENEVLEHYIEDLSKHADWWVRNRMMRLDGPEGDEVFHFSSNAKIHYPTRRGLRIESLFEDDELVERVLHGLTGEAREKRFRQFMRHVLAACESTFDFAPGWQASDYKSMEELRTEDIAPVFLQASMVHLFRLAGREQEANKLAEIINRRFWRDIDDERGQYGDLLRDGTMTEALTAVMAYPLMVGGIVPYERAVKLAKTWKEELQREYGFLISTATTGQQWDGDPGKEDRGWPSVNMWLVECFVTAAQEAKMNGHDPEPLLEVAEMARAGFVEGIRKWFLTYRDIPEKYSVTDPVLRVGGGEYVNQKGFGMTIGAYRALVDRDLRAEVYSPRDHSRRQHTVRHLSNLALAA